MVTPPRANAGVRAMEPPERVIAKVVEEADLPIVNGEALLVPSVPAISVRPFDTDNGTCRSTAGEAPEVLFNVILLMLLLVKVPAPVTTCWAVPLKTMPLPPLPSPLNAPEFNILPLVVSTKPPRPN